MCDTLVALKNSTSDGSVIIVKNSDREPNEGQGLIFFPRQQHDPDTSFIFSPARFIKYINRVCIYNSPIRC